MRNIFKTFFSLALLHCVVSITKETENKQTAKKKEEKKTASKQHKRLASNEGEPRV